MIPLFIVLAILLVLIILFLIFFPKIRRSKYRKNFVSIYGKKVYRYALHNDLYLINKLELKGNDDQTLVVDHLLFGNKYIYLISDYYLPGAIEAKANDRSFVYSSNERKAQKVYIDNILLKGKELTHKVASNLGLNISLFIPIAVVNNDSDFQEFRLNEIDNYMIHIGSLKKVLNALESRKVAPLNDEQLKYTVKDVNRLNERRKRNQHKQTNKR